MSDSLHFVLHHGCAPGDTVVMTGLVRDLALSYPHHRISVATHAPDIWRNNPYVCEAPSHRSPQRRDLKLDYGAGIREQKTETIHFLSYFHRNFTKQTELPVPVLLPYPDLHLSEEERQPIVSGRYWVVVSGGKSDVTIKVWHRDYFQAVVDVLRSRGITCVQAGGTDTGHWQPPLDGVLNLVGHTNLRDMARLIHHADGVICGVSLPMHMAAALQRPCVVLGGGREAWWWEAYTAENRGFGDAIKHLRTPHRFLHTIGLLDCCATHGCWKKHVVPLVIGEKSLCRYPERVGDIHLARCMNMITPAHVVKAVMSYYEDNSLPPIDVAPENALQVRPAAATPEIPKLIGQFEGRGAVRQAATAPQPKQSRGRRSVRPAAVKVAPMSPPVSPALDASIFDHPTIGGKYTLFILMYGDYYPIHQECLSRLLSTVPHNRIDLRIGSNQLCPRSLELVEDHVSQGLVTKHYRHTGNCYKYPVMREMFHDPDLPIRTNYLIWFDDDTICDRGGDWLYNLTKTILDHHDHQPEKGPYRMFGPIRYFNLLPGQPAWIKQATWYKGRHFQDGAGNPSPNARKIRFASGSCWALHVETMRQCDIPDVRLRHNGGDYMIGAQLWQNGFRVGAFASQKEHLTWSKYKRRGYAEKHAGVT